MTDGTAERGIYIGEEKMNGIGSPSEDALRDSVIPPKICAFATPCGEYAKNVTQLLDTIFCGYLISISSEYHIVRFRSLGKLG